MSIQEIVLLNTVMVHLHTEVNGGRKYEKTDVATDVDGNRVTTDYHGKKIVEDAEELQRAEQIRGAASNAVKALCSAGDCGLNMRPENRQKLREVYEEHTATVELFNSSARFCHIVFIVRTGTIDNEPFNIDSMKQEMDGLLTEMLAAIDAVDINRIRATATKAKLASRSLAPAAESKMRAAWEAAQEVATALKKRVIKHGELAESVIKELNTEAIKSARFNTLDRSTGEMVRPVQSTGRVANLDTADIAPPPVAPKAPRKAAKRLETDEDVTAAPVAFGAPRAKRRALEV